MVKPVVAWDTTNPIWANPQYPERSGLGNIYIPVPLVISNAGEEGIASVKLHVFIEDKDGNRVGTYEANKFIRPNANKVTVKVYTPWSLTQIRQDLYVKAQFDGTDVMVKNSPRVSSTPIYGKLVFGQRWTSIQNAPVMYLDTQGNTILPEVDGANSATKGGYGGTIPVDIPERDLPQTPPSQYDLDPSTVTQALPPIEPPSGYSSGMPLTTGQDTTTNSPATTTTTGQGSWLQNLFAAIFGRRTTQPQTQPSQGLRLPWT